MRRPQFSLKTLLWLMAVVSLWCSMYQLAFPVLLSLNEESLFFLVEHIPEAGRLSIAFGVLGGVCWFKAYRVRNMARMLWSAAAVVAIAFFILTATLTTITLFATAEV
jgi:hypothetical protein